MRFKIHTIFIALFGVTLKAPSAVVRSMGGDKEFLVESKVGPQDLSKGNLYNPAMTLERTPPELLGLAVYSGMEGENMSFTVVRSLIPAGIIQICSIAQNILRNHDKHNPFGRIMDRIHELYAQAN